MLLAVLVMQMLVGCKKHYVSGLIDEEAKKQGEIFWEKTFSKCGDSYYRVYAPIASFI